MQIIVSHWAQNRKRSISFHVKNNLRLTLILKLNLRIEVNIIQVQSQVILQDKVEICEPFIPVKKEFVLIS